MRSGDADADGKGESGGREPEAGAERGGVNDAVVGH